MLTSPAAQQLVEKFADGKTVAQVVESNDCVIDAANRLVRIVEIEAGQRQTMESRFANRLTTAPTSDFDLPT